MNKPIEEDRILNLRNELNRITKLSTIRQDEEINNLNNKYGCEIELKEFPPDNLNDNYNCFEYSLELHASDEYKQIRKELVINGFSNIFCNNYFLGWLIKKKILISTCKEDGEAIVLYYKINGYEKELNHAGILQRDEKIISKWGTGCLYKHFKDEVPEDYGDPRSTYKILEKDKALKYFKAYLNELVSILNKLKIDN